MDRPVLVRIAVAHCIDHEPRLLRRGGVVQVVQPLGERGLTQQWKVLSQRDSISCDTRYFDHLDQVADDGYLVPHVLFDHVCLEDPFAARGFSIDTIDGLREYISRYILVPKG